VGKAQENPGHLDIECIKGSPERFLPVIPSVSTVQQAEGAKLPMASAFGE